MRKKLYIAEYIQDYTDVELPKSRRLSPNSCASYMLTLRQFFDWYKLTTSRPAEEIMCTHLSFDMIRDFLSSSLEKHQWSRSTYNLKLAGMKAFIRYLALVEPSFLDLYRRTKLLPGQRVPKSRVEYLTESQLLSQLNFEPRSFIELRDRSAILFMFYTGCRVAELTNARMEDFTWVSSKSAYVSIIGKGRKTRQIPIREPQVLEGLKMIERYARNGLKSHVFPTRDGGIMSTDNVRRIVAKYYRGEFSKLNITPHSIRHSAAMHWLDKNVDIYTISALLGHDTVQTTEGYLKSRYESHDEKLSAIASDDTKARIFKTPFGTNDSLIQSLNLKIRNSNRFGEQSSSGEL